MEVADSLRRRMAKAQNGRSDSRMGRHGRRNVVIFDGVQWWLKGIPSWDWMVIEWAAQSMSFFQLPQIWVAEIYAFLGRRNPGSHGVNQQTNGCTSLFVAPSCGDLCWVMLRWCWESLQLVNSHVIEIGLWKTPQFIKYIVIHMKFIAIQYHIKLSII